MPAFLRLGPGPGRFVGYDRLIPMICDLARQRLRKSIHPAALSWLDSGGWRP